MTGDVLVPVLVTFLIVNVVLIVRAVARDWLGRSRGAAVARLPGVAAATPDPMEAQPVSDVAGRGVTAATTAAPPDAEDQPALAVAAATPDSTGIPSAPDPTDAPDQTEAEPVPLLTASELLPGLDDEAEWDRRVADENARLTRYRRPVTIVRIELDGLDRLVELLGAEAGDRLLRATADTLRRLARDTDHVARLGPAGFGVLLPETPADAAVVYVSRVRRACELWLESGAVAVNLAIGWAATSGEVGLADVQRLAVERMHDGSQPEASGAGSPSDPRPPVAEVPLAVVPPTRPPVAEVPLAVVPPTRPPVADVPPDLVLTPALSWETCRDPNCNHKEDHRRDRRPRSEAG